MHIAIMNPQRYLLITFNIFLLLLILTAHFDPVTSQYEVHYCSNNRNYTSESLYRANLKSLPSISSNVGNNGFYSTSLGPVNVIALCRGDIQPNECRGCVSNVATEILQLCPDQIEAIRWSQYCMIRYSDKPILGTLETRPSFGLYNTQNATSLDRFKEVVRMLLDELRRQAAKGGPLRKAAAANATTANVTRPAAPGIQTIYAMVQCTPDLSEENCDTCLVQATQSIVECCGTKIGARVYSPSCLVRYESAPFYNITRLQEPLDPPSSPPLDPPSLPSSPPLLGKNDDNSTRNIIIIVISTFMGLILTIFVGIFTIKRIKQKKRENLDGEGVDDISTIESIQYDFGQIRAATNDFSDENKLGQGGFGAVYKGKLVNGREIAVKRLSRNSGQGDLEFKNEVLLLARLQHRNLVRLLGFSMEGSERLLIYEFHQNGSLDHFIFDPMKSSDLSWEIRYKIIGGIAKGLLYMHEDSRLRIIHRDLKASNVLLDEGMIPKISDFGMAKLILQDVTQESTSRVVGTYGYMAPEYAIQGHFSIKSDVYSFGVLVLEIISGSKRVHFQNGRISADLLSYAWRSWREGSTANLIDPVLGANSGSQVDMVRCIHIALLCVQENAADRPTMASVVLMLNSFSLTLPLPSEPAFYVPTSSSESASLLQEYNSKEKSTSSSKSKLSAQAVAYSSKNDGSITELYPR